MVPVVFDVNEQEPSLALTPSTDSSQRLLGEVFGHVFGGSEVPNFDAQPPLASPPVSNSAINAGLLSLRSGCL